MCLLAVQKLISGESNSTRVLEKASAFLQWLTFFQHLIHGPMFAGRGFHSQFCCPRLAWLGSSLCEVSLWLHCRVLLLCYLLYGWGSAFPNGMWCPAPCSITVSALSTVGAESWHQHIAPSLQSLRNYHCRGSQSIPFLGRLVVACHHVGI